jgi:hypothetical protein
MEYVTMCVNFNFFSCGQKNGNLDIFSTHLNFLSGNTNWNYYSQKKRGKKKKILLWRIVRLSFSMK